MITKKGMFTNYSKTAYLCLTRQSFHKTIRDLIPIRDPILFKWHLTNSIETKLHLVFFQFIHKCNSSQVWIHICGLNIAFGCHFCHIWFYWVPTNDMGVKCLFGQCHIRRGVITGGGDASSLIPNSSLVLYLNTVAPDLALYLSKSDIWSN